MIEDASSQAAPALFTDVLCAIDGTRTTLRAVARACELLGPDGRLTILLCTHEAGGGRWRTAAVSRSRARRALGRAAELARKAGFEAETVLDPGGPPPQRVLEHAADHHLLAVGAPAVPRAAGLVIGGGVTLQAVHHLPSSLLIARGEPLASGDQVLLAIDGPQDAPGLADIGAYAARHLDRGVLMLHAVGVEGRSTPHHVAAQRERLGETLGRPPELVVEADDPADAIVGVARRQRTSLIVMGSRRVGGVRALSSVSEQVAHRARCSVLVVRPEERGA